MTRWGGMGVLGVGLLGVGLVGLGCSDKGAIRGGLDAQTGSSGINGEPKLSGGGDNDESGTTGVVDGGDSGEPGEPGEPGGKLDVGGADGPSGPDDSACPCGQLAQRIYVLSDSASLWTFEPELNRFEELGPFACPGATGSTFSMGVARSGVAWVKYSPDGDVFHVDVNNDNACSDPGYSPEHAFSRLFGMAFVSESEQDPCDSLYAHSYSGSGPFSEGVGRGELGVLVDLEPQRLGAVDFDGGELTGTGDGRLFAFAGTNPAKLIEYDKSNAAVIAQTNLDGLELTTAFAFAFWGGDFYMFTEAGGPGSASQVTRFDHDGDGTLEVVAQAPVRVVGAGVSTCAPFVPPG